MVHKHSAIIMQCEHYEETAGGQLRVAPVLLGAVSRAAAGTGVAPARFWSSFSDTVQALGPGNRALLARRDALQARVDAWHGSPPKDLEQDLEQKDLEKDLEQDLEQKDLEKDLDLSEKKEKRSHGAAFDPARYEAFLREIGYLLPETGPSSAEAASSSSSSSSSSAPSSTAAGVSTFSAAEICTRNVDAELRTAGPQLVVPADNARYALNAANARWGSLYDALYGTNIIGDEDGAARSSDGSFNPTRGRRVFDYTHALLDEIAPLAEGVSYAAVRSFRVEGGGGAAAEGDPNSNNNNNNNNMRFSAMVTDGNSGSSRLRGVPLRDPSQFIGFSGDASSLGQVVLRHHGLHVILRVDHADSVGITHPAGLAGVELEAAVSHHRF